MDYLASLVIGRSNYFGFSFVTLNFLREFLQSKRAEIYHLAPSNCDSSRLRNHFTARWANLWQFAFQNWHTCTSFTWNFRDNLILRISRFIKNREIKVTRKIRVANITWPGNLVTHCVNNPERLSLLPLRRPCQGKFRQATWAKK